MWVYLYGVESICVIPSSSLYKKATHVIIAKIKNATIELVNFETTGRETFMFFSIV